MNKEEYNELVDKAKLASEAYYNGHETMSNREFDEIIDRINQFEYEEGIVRIDSPSKTVGASPVDTLPKFKHIYPALSLDKTKDIRELVRKFQDGINESNDENNDGVVVMWKEDGSTVQAYYYDGKLQHLVTRGNGEIGSDITHNASAIKGVPLTIPEMGEVVVRGEALISYEDFEKINSELPEDQQYKNPRNLAAASIQMLDPKEVECRHVIVKAFNLVKIDKELNSFAFRLNVLKQMGFDVVERWVGPVCCLEQAVENMTKQVEDYPYPVDGLVVAMNNYKYAMTLEGTEHHPNIMQGYAFKWEDELHNTVLRDIEWSPSRTGLLNPVAIFDPVEIDGTTVKRASLHNVSVLKEMRLHIGNRISVFKANMIIPQVFNNIDYDTSSDYSDSELLDLVGKCPKCNHNAALNISKEGVITAYCPNSNCSVKMVGKFVHFCSRDCMDIQGMSEETIIKLVDNGFIKEYSDFFKLSNQPAIAYIPGFGKTSWNKMCQASELARKVDFVNFINSLSIPNLGKGQAKTLLNYLTINYNNLCSICGLSSCEEVDLLTLLRYLVDIKYDFSKVDGFGSVIATNLSQWVAENLCIGGDTPEIRLLDYISIQYIKPLINLDTTAISGKSFCITGKLNHFANRQELVDKIESLGGKWVDSVSAKTDYLINNDVNSSSGKNKKAKELNIPIISEDDFIHLLES